MSEIDISPEAVERLAASLNALPQHYTLQMLRALRAALTEAEMERDAVRAQLNLATIHNLVAKERAAAASDMRERAARVLEDEAAFLDANAFARPRCPIETKREDAAAIRALPLTKGGSDAAE